MKQNVEFGVNKATTSQILEHLWRCDADFVPPLSGRVDISSYAGKITKDALRFEAWDGDTLVGLVAAYCNGRMLGTAYITNVSVLFEWKGQGIGQSLIRRCINNAKESGMRQVSLKVANDNLPAIKLYSRSGFIVREAGILITAMDLYLKKGEVSEQ